MAHSQFDTLGNFCCAKDDVLLGVRSRVAALQTSKGCLPQLMVAHLLSLILEP